MLTEKQRLARMGGVGASDAPIILGLSPYKTPLRLYMEKRGEIEPDPPNEAMEWGNLLEPAIITKAERKLKLRFRRRLGTLHHPKMRFIFANCDGANLSERALIEAKRSGDGRGYGADGSDEVPEIVKAQVQQQLGVASLALGVKFMLAYVPVLIGLHEHRIMRVPYDPKVSRDVIECSRSFWIDHVKQGKPPALTNAADVALRWPLPKGALPVADDIALEIAALKAEREGVTLKENAIERRTDALKLLLGKHEAMTYQGRVIATFKAEERAKLDGARLLKWLRRQHPRMKSLDRFENVSAIRVLRLK